jgi:flagellar biosynthesis/type III secretory pathway protein FliH
MANSGKKDYDEGYSQGYDEGRKDGYALGYDEGLRQGKQEYYERSLRSKVDHVRYHASSIIHHIGRLFGKRR